MYAASVIEGIWRGLENLANQNLAAEFAAHGYVRLPGLLAGTACTRLATELAVIPAQKRNFIMPGYQTPRVMQTIGAKAFAERTNMLKSIYFDQAIRQAISRIVGEDISSCQNEYEWMVANYLSRAGDTHGWHLDDPPIAFVLILEAPAEGNGGYLEYFPHFSMFDHKINAVKAEHRGGDAYILRADRCLHRVAPLKTNGLRVAVNMAFELDQAVTYGITASMLYR